MQGGGGEAEGQPEVKPLDYVLEGSGAAARLAGVRASYHVTAGLLMARAEAGLPDIASHAEKLEKALLLAIADKQVRRQRAAGFRGIE